MAVVETLRVRKAQEVADACCDPDCGPDTCGSPASAAQAVEPADKAKAVQECCDPACGPGTCG